MLENKSLNTANVKKRPISKMKKTYIVRLVLRCFAFLFFLYLYLFKPNQLDILHGMNFFKEFSFLHIIWLVWMIDMIIQIIPTKAPVSIGSLKLFKRYFVESKKEYDHAEMKRYFKKANLAAGMIFFIWVILISAIGVLHHFGIIREAEMFMISVLFYVFDLICVVIWCPFRLMLHTRCCTTCRIFNWDHLMMFTPMLFVKGFFSISLNVVAAIVFILWELAIFMHPERFWERTNCSLNCANCNDKLCRKKLIPQHKPNQNNNSVTDDKKLSESEIMKVK